MKAIRIRKGRGRREDVREPSSWLFLLVRPAHVNQSESPGQLRDACPFLCPPKERIRSAQLRTGLADNRELIELYWQIGRSIVERQALRRLGKVRR